MSNTFREQKTPVLGIDLGSTSLAAILLDSSGTTLFRHYAPHGGNIPEALSALDDELDAVFGVTPTVRALGVAVTGSLAEGALRHDLRVDSRVACIRSVRARYPEAREILLVGSEHFSLIRFGEDGQYRSVRTNTSCAAGTGGFLDQQAGRLSMADSAELSTTALENTDPVPPVATRCAVFAKTDLIHAQQEGYSLSAISTGLCRGVARNLVDTLFKEEAVLGPVVMTGGVSRNDAVVREVSALLPAAILVDEDGPLQGAIGAALTLRESDRYATWDPGEARDTDGRQDSWRTRDVDDGHDTRNTRDSESRIRDVRTPVSRAVDLHVASDPDRSGMFPPLELSRSEYPDFSSYRNWDEHGVEVDLYQPWSARQDAYLGIDIGSTSTKAALTTLEGEMLGGFYTRTAGRPLRAVQAVLRAITVAAERETAEIAIHGSATTGSGRKFVGGIIGADEIIDEISAHARAAVELNPRVDTILEIGGQDAKFTTLHNGRVTSSVMNTVCAAGTGSFLEEQARRLGVPLSDFADRTRGVRAPRVNDRCTVFMDRDINHLLATGYSVPEVLAAGLHAVRENYLNRVAVEKRIGQVVFFQGATAKNRSLVAAFEQKLQRPILVSPYCHLTGALGAALTLVDGGTVSDRFVGLQLWSREIPVRREVCELCANHCKLTVADLENKSVAFGFRCGRDYETDQYVDHNTSGFDLLRERRAVDRRLMKEFAPTGASSTDDTPPVGDAFIGARESSVREGGASAPVIGLPDALYMTEDLPFWQVFFANLGIPTRTSSRIADPIRRGRLSVGAEFCAPMTALHGHAAELLKDADYLFLPVYMERKPERPGSIRKYCYYSQFAASLVSQSLAGADADEAIRDRVLSPLVSSRYTRFHLIGELHRVLSVLGDRRPRFYQVASALDGAQRFRERRSDAMRELFWQRRLTSGHEGPAPRGAASALRDGAIAPGSESALPREAVPRHRDKSASTGGGPVLDVVLLGRPYTVLSPHMNKGIPGIFGALGVRAFYQDMLPHGDGDTDGVDPLLREVNWNYGATILAAAEITANTPGLYPVLLSSFKCGPDSFVMEYARKIFDAHDKPYLLLELDEHDSSVGYETRIEAALRSFRTHAEAARSSGPVVYDGINPRYLDRPDAERMLVLPRWDDYTVPLLAAILNAQGYPTIVMEETEATIRRSLRWNNGQCIPMNAIAEAFVETVQSRGLSPAKTMLWVPSGEFACNIRLFPHHIQETLSQYGQGFEDARVYVGHLTHVDISPLVTARAYLAHMFAGLIRRIACRIRPYEYNSGETDRTVEEALAILQEVFLGTRTNYDSAVAEIMARFERIEFDRDARRPKVALFGDLYVRDNPVMNQDVIHYIENNGGEVVTMPFHEFTRMISGVYARRWVREGKFRRFLTLKPLMAAMSTMERWYYRHFEPIIGEPVATFDENPADVVRHFDIRLDHEGESQDNLLKTWYISRRHPDLALFLQLNPGFCCAGLVTEAMSSRIRAVTGVPVLSITYDGTGGNRNEAILPYLMHTDEPRARDAGGLLATSADPEEIA